MNQRLRAVLLCVCATSAACASSLDDAPTERALRFAQFAGESATDPAHGGGAWHDALYLPDHGVVCQVLFLTDVDAPPARGGAHAAQTPEPAPFRGYALLNAYHGTLGEELAARPQDAPAARRPLQEIRLPRDLVRAIVAHAEQTRELKRRGEQLAARCIALGVVGDGAGAGDGKRNL